MSRIGLVYAQDMYVQDNEDIHKRTYTSSITRYRCKIERRGPVQDSGFSVQVTGFGVFDIRQERRTSVTRGLECQQNEDLGSRDTVQYMRARI